MWGSIQAETRAPSPGDPGLRVGVTCRPGRPSWFVPSTVRFSSPSLNPQRHHPRYQWRPILAINAHDLNVNPRIQVMLLLQQRHQTTNSAPAAPLKRQQDTGTYGFLHITSPTKPIHRSKTDWFTSPRPLANLPTLCIFSLDIGLAIHQCYSKPSGSDSPQRDQWFSPSVLSVSSCPQYIQRVMI